MTLVPFFFATPAGEIVMAGVCAEREVEHQSCDGATLYRGHARVGEDYFDGSVVLPLPARPSESHRFDYGVGAWALDADAAWAAVRVERNRRIAETDWTVLPDVQMSEELRAQWEAYRQALRDVTEQPDPLAIVWPEVPG